MFHSSPLRALLFSYLTDEIPLYELRGGFYSNEMILADDSEDGLYESVSMHLAMYTVGTWPESALKEAITWHIAHKNGEEVPQKMPMLDKTWLDIMSSGIAPWPIKLEVHSEDSIE